MEATGIVQCDHTRLFHGVTLSDLVPDVHDVPTTLPILPIGVSNIIDARQFWKSIELTRWHHVGRITLEVHRDRQDSTWVFHRFALLGNSSFCLACNSHRKCHHFPSDRVHASVQVDEVDDAQQRDEEFDQELERLIGHDGKFKILSWSQRPFKQHTDAQNEIILYRHKWIATRLHTVFDESKGIQY